MFIFRETINVALASIRANALRSGLTTLGIVIGTGAVITMVALGEGAQRAVEDQIERMGTNVLTVRPGQNWWRGVGSGSVRLEESDAWALRDQMGGMYSIAPEAESRLQIAYLRWNSSNQVVGTWPAYFEIHERHVTHGRVFNEGESQGRQRVAVLGSDVPDALGTPAALLVGREIQIRGIRFEVLGVLEEKGSMGWENPDEQVYIPLSTALYRVMGNRDRLRAIYVAAPSPEQLDPAWGDIDRIIRRDVLSRLIWGARISIYVALSVVLLSLTFGSILGAVAGYAGGWLERFLMMGNDILLAFPGFLLALALVAARGSTLENVILAVAIAYTPRVAAVMRSVVLTIRPRPFIEASQAIGMGSFRVLWRHVLPNSLPPVIVVTTVSAATAILAEAGLSFLGLGVQPPTATWGNVISDGQGYILSNPLISVSAGLCIAITVIALNLLGDGLRDTLDPQMRRYTSSRML